MFLKLTKLLVRYYWILIAVVILISNGQTLFMLPWQDDNALFFKLSHINDNVGFLGPGIFGRSAYKYTAFFYYPIYLIFKYQPFFYFALGLIFYAVSVFVLYKVVSKIFDKNTGMLAGFLFASGFVGSESYIRIFNSVITSLSVILVSIFFYFYWKFYEIRRYRWYFLSVLLFFLASEFARARTHYLIIIPLVFEILFLLYRSRKRAIKSVILSVTRLLPFFYLFNKYILMEDSRSGQAVVLIKSIFAGNFYNTFGFFSSFSNLVLPNWLLGLTRSAQEKVLGTSFLSDSIFYYLIYFLLLTIFLVFVFRQRNNSGRVFALITLAFSLLWFFISSKIYINSHLDANQSQVFVAFIGGELVYFAFSIAFLLKKKFRILYLLFLSGIFMNLLSYSSYYPLLTYEKINRYFSHSLIYLTLLFVFLYYVYQKNKRVAFTIFTLLFLWGIGNLVESFVFQRRILLYRTDPVNKFYQELKRKLPVVNKGDVILFDVASGVQGNFADAFSVAQMPETTAIAWRYGLDRYDFEMYTDSQQFLNNLYLKAVPQERIHTFFYSKDGLADTTNEFKLYLSNKKRQLDLQLRGESDLSTIEGVGVNLINKAEVILNPEKSINSTVPFKLLLEIQAQPFFSSELEFPFSYGVVGIENRGIYSDKTFLYLVQEYYRFKNIFRRFEVTASSYWQDRVVQNLTDGDPQSVWQANRLSWIKDDQFLLIKTGGFDTYDRAALVNAYSDSTLTEFEILASEDGLSWSLVDVLKNEQRYPNGGLMVFDFPPQKAMFFKILFKKTLNDDSSAISEMWLIPSKFSNLSISEAERYLSSPFGYVVDNKLYQFLLASFDYKGKFITYWENNKNFGWQSSKKSEVNIIYDGRAHYYEIPITPGGTSINKFRFLGADIPGNFKILSVKVEY